jgi:hypothetical protein
MKIDRRWTWLGLRAIVMENRALRIVVLPEVGGRIWSIVHKPTDRELLWQNPRVAPRKVPFGAGYDDVWCGGWEEVFPNDAPGTINGEPFPDHGETWSIEWDCEVAGDELRMCCLGPISGMRVEKRLRLPGDDAAALEVHYRIENPTLVPFPFLLKAHAAVAVAPGCRIEYPAGMKVELEPAFPGTLSSAEQGLAATVAPPPADRQLHFYYGSGFDQGRCRIADPATGLRWGLDFDPRILSSWWLFASYGGWRNYYVAVLEPATCHPFEIGKAIERGVATVLASGAALETQVTFRVES